MLMPGGGVKASNSFYTHVIIMMNINFACREIQRVGNDRL